MKGKIVIICGNKRAGKTTLAILLHKKYNFNYYNFDMLLDSLEETFVKLDDNDEKKYLKLLENMVASSLEDAKNYRVNTVYDYIFSPQDLADFKYKNQVEIYFLANLDANLKNIKEDLLKYSETYDWPSYATEEDLTRNIKYILNNNDILKDQCQKYNFVLINTSRGEKRNQILEQLAFNIANNKL